MDRIEKKRTPTNGIIIGVHSLLSLGILFLIWRRFRTYHVSKWIFSASQWDDGSLTSFGQHKAITATGSILIGSVSFSMSCFRQSEFAATPHQPPPIPYDYEVEGTLVLGRGSAEAGAKDCMNQLFAYRYFCEEADTPSRPYGGKHITPLWVRCPFSISEAHARRILPDTHPSIVICFRETGRILSPAGKTPGLRSRSGRYPVQQ